MYKSEKINEYTYKILDSYDEAMYLIAGSQKALLIDAGMEKQSLYKYVSSLTTKPILLALTHGHIDHIGQSGSFENVYMNLLDRGTYLLHMHMKAGHFNSDGLNFKKIDDIQNMPDYFDLGDRKIDILPLGGHTPGSVIFVDQNQKSVFTGDAIGSGCGCWMQMDECLSIKQYHQNLLNVLKQLQDRRVDTTWHFYGGHDKQEYQSKVSHLNRLDIQLLKDMEQLCCKLMQHDIVFYDTGALKMTNIPYYVCHQKAEMIVTKEKIGD